MTKPLLRCNAMFFKDVEPFNKDPKEIEPDD